MTTRAKRPVPEGFHTVTPQLTLENTAQAIDWYKKALGAEEISRAGRWRNAEPSSSSSRRSSTPTPDDTIEDDHRDEQDETEKDRADHAGHAAGVAADELSLVEHMPLHRAAKIVFARDLRVAETGVERERLKDIAV